MPVSETLIASYSALYACTLIWKETLPLLSIINIHFNRSSKHWWLLFNKKKFSQQNQNVKTTRLYILYKLQMMHRRSKVNRTEPQNAMLLFGGYNNKQTNKNSEHYKTRPSRFLFHTVLSRSRQSSIICPRTLDWWQLLRHFCRSDSHPEKCKERRKKSE